MLALEVMGFALIFELLILIYGLARMLAVRNARAQKKGMYR